MSQRKILRRPLRKVSSGDMRTPIVISLKAIAAPIAESVNPAMGFADLPYCWSKAETKSRKELFAGTQLLGVRTHTFTVRFPDEPITVDHVIIYEGVILDVLSTENWEQRNEYLVIDAGEKGPQEYASNF